MVTDVDETADAPVTEEEHTETVTADRSLHALAVMLMAAIVLVVVGVTFVSLAAAFIVAGVLVAGWAFLLWGGALARGDG